MVRPATTEWNLAVNWHEQDVQNAEFLRTYRSQTFAGGLLLRRLEAEQSKHSQRDVIKELPAVGDKEVPEHLYLRCFDDIYGFRGDGNGYSRHVYYLSPWEFLTHWECVPLPKPPEMVSANTGMTEGTGLSQEHAARDAGRSLDPGSTQQALWGRTNDRGVPLSAQLDAYDYGPNAAAEDDDVIFFSSEIPGPSPLHRRWYLRRRRRPMVPAPANTPLPESQKDAEKKARLYSLYMRPWTLMPKWSTPQVPLLADLDVVPQAAAMRPRKRCRTKTSVGA